MSIVTIIDLWTDGVCSGNPGPCKARWLWKNGAEVKGEKDLGHGTNNYAELAAVGCGLSALHSAIVDKGQNPTQYKIALRCDSQTALDWLNGTTPGDGVSARDIVMRMVARIKDHLVPRFANVRFIQIKGKKNLADPGNKP